MKILILLISFLTIEPTPQNVYNYCKEIDIQHPEIVTAQAIQETGWFTCKKCSLSRNNIFGFYYKGSYLEFTNWKESVSYYKRWQDRHYDSKRDYYEFLACIYKNKRGECIKYAADPVKYNAHVMSIVNKHSKGWIKH